MRTYYYTSEGQMIVDRTFAFFPFFFGLFLKAYVYSPLLLTGYLICRQLFPPGTKGYYWVGTIILIAVLIYGIIFILKGIVIGLRARRNYAWVLVWAICVVYTSLPPAMIAYHFLHTRVPYPWLVWLLSSCAGLFVYAKYNFLLDLVPARMWGLYLTGLRIGRHPAL